MASKFVELSEAAKQLGITADELNDARNAGEVHGFRDGSSWKFKPQELERFAEERGVSLLQVALQFCLSEHRMHGHPIGSLNVEQLEQNVRAAITPIDDSILDEIQQVGL